MSIESLIRAIVKPLIKDQIFKAVVVSVDKGKDVCVVKAVKNDSERFNVQLRAVVDEKKNGLIIYPKEGSDVLVGLIGNNDADCFIVECSEVDEIVYMDGSNGGLIKVAEIVKQINALEIDITALKAVFAAWQVLPLDGGLVLKTGATAWAAKPLVPTTVVQLENKKFTH